MARKKRDAGPRLVGGEAWQIMQEIRLLKRKYDQALEHIPVYGEFRPITYACPSACEIIWDVKEALAIMADITVALQEALGGPGSKCCKVKLNLTGAAGGEELISLKGGKCSGLMVAGEELDDMEVCRALGLLRDWLLNCSKMLC